MPLRLGLWEILMVLPTIAIYFTPTIVAIFRRARHLPGILVLNILAGWTFLGWLAALIWSIRDRKQAVA
ncbi:MAG: superinfection immunity protein [Chloroflexota bacterium]